VSYSNIDIIGNLNNDKAYVMFIALKARLEQVGQELSTLNAELEDKKSEYNDCLEMMEMLKHMMELKSAPTVPDKPDESYSRDWKWPTKTLYVLRRIKRSLSANEVLRSIEIYEGKKVADDKKTSVFTALTNLTKENKIIRSKPGAEYVYCLPEYVEKTKHIEQVTKELPENN
jgi:seryl-tRNA synthetase